MNIKPIRADKDYQNALKRIDMLMDAEQDTPEGDELEILAILIEKYEQEHFPIKAPDPISAIKFRMEQLGISQEDFARIVGANRASEILNGQRGISTNQLRVIHHTLGIPYESLLDSPLPAKQNTSH